VTDLATSKSVIVIITDRGPRVPGRMLDLSLGAARTLGLRIVAWSTFALR